MPDLVLRRVDLPEELSAIYGLRVQAWKTVLESRIEGDAWTDRHDEHSIHWAVFEGPTIVASARACIHSSLAELPDGGYTQPCDDPSAAAIVPPILSLSRLVVDPAKRRLGLGTLLDDARIRFAREAGVRTVIGMTMDESRMRALERRGFVKTTLGLARIVAATGGETPVTVLILSL